MIHTSTGGEIKTVTTQYKVSSWPPTYVGNGFSVGGTIVGLRAHTVQDSANKYNRYLVLQVDVDEVRNRIFNEKGEEVDALYDTSNTKAKGHLNHFNTTDNDPNRLTVDQLLSRLGGSTLPDNLYNEERSKLHPYVKSRFEFWGDVNFMKPFDFKVGQNVKLKTKSDSIFVESVGKSETATNYRGENVIGGWTSKISTASNTKVAEQSHKPLPGEDKQGVDDSEWD